MVDFEDMENRLYIAKYGFYNLPKVVDKEEIWNKIKEITLGY